MRCWCCTGWPLLAGSGGSGASSRTCRFLTRDRDSSGATIGLTDFFDHGMVSSSAKPPKSVKRLHDHVADLALQRPSATHARPRALVVGRNQRCSAASRWATAAPRSSNTVVTKPVPPGPPLWATGARIIEAEADARREGNRLAHGLFGLRRAATLLTRRCVPHRPCGGGAGRRLPC